MKPVTDQPRAADEPFTLRPVQPEDESFLFELYCSTRADELAQWGWGAEQCEMFLRLQFRAQSQHFRQSAAQTTDHLVLLSGSPAGRIRVFRGEREYCLVDVALLTACRGRGIGTMLLRSLQAEAEAARLPVTLHVLTGSRAVALYERLGFERVRQDGPHWLMVWLPEALK